MATQATPEKSTPTPGRTRVNVLAFATPTTTRYLAFLAMLLGAGILLALAQPLCDCLAPVHWPAAKRRERDLTYNLRTRAQLDQLSPGFPWQPLLAAQGLDMPSLPGCHGTDRVTLAHTVVLAHRGTDIDD